MRRANCPRAASRLAGRGPRLGPSGGHRYRGGGPELPPWLEWPGTEPRGARPLLVRGDDRHFRGIESRRQSPLSPANLARMSARLAVPVEHPEPRVEGRLELSLVEMVGLHATILLGMSRGPAATDPGRGAADDRAERRRRLHQWVETLALTARERCALAWTDAVISAASGPIPDAAFEAVRTQFSEAEVVLLTKSIAAIGAGLRLAVTTPPG